MIRNLLIISGAGLILAIVGIGITVVVYGVVALIVKADDAGMALAANERPAASLLGLRRLKPGEAGGVDRALSWLTQPLGRGLVVAMPHFLNLLGMVGTAAMLWVGGGIIIHGLEAFGVAAPAHWLHDIDTAMGGGLLGWCAQAAVSGVVGLAIGVAIGPVVSRVLGKGH